MLGLYIYLIRLPQYRHQKAFHFCLKYKNLKSASEFAQNHAIKD